MCRSTSRPSSAAARSTERRGWLFESNRSPQIEDRVDLLVQGELDRALEGVELPLTLRGRGRAQVVVAGTEVHVGHVQQARHAADVPPRVL